jgi:hypothetical protein
MLYFVGGPPRCGKSELALRLCRAHGLPFISTDVLWGLLELAIPEWRTPMEKGPDRIPMAAGLFRPYLDRVVDRLHRRAADFVVEGELIVPRDAASLASTFPLRSVFLVRSHVTAEHLVGEGGTNPWLAGASRDLLHAVAAEVRAYSTSMAQECAVLELPCVDVGGDFEAGMREAEERLGLA